MSLHGSSKRGLLIAVEGVDGSGKSVQVRLLADAVRERGRVPRVLREPGGTPLGEELRRALLETEGGVEDPLVAALLFMASRRQLVVEQIVPALARGEIVILDRSYYSTWVYQGVVGGVDLDFLETMTDRVHREAKLDRVLLLDVDSRVALARREARGSADAIEARGASYLEGVVHAFRDMARRHADEITVIDADGTVEAVHERCVAALDALLEQVGTEDAAS